MVFVAVTMASQAIEIAVDRVGVQPELLRDLNDPGSEQSGRANKRVRICRMFCQAHHLHHSSKFNCLFLPVVATGDHACSSNRGEAFANCNRQWCV